MKKSRFDLSHYKNFSCSMGELVPIMCEPVLPGDVFQHHTSAVIRAMPMTAPVMHPVRVKIHHWFVPNRLIWTDWENFITGGPDGLNASTAPTITVNTGTGWANGSLADYFGIPTLVDDIAVDAMPFRAYAKIWNDNYRDPDLSTALTIDLTDGADTTTNTTLQKVCWEKDYFTTARLTAQKGAAVSLPLGTSANVYGPTPNTGGTNKSMYQMWNSTDGAVQYGSLDKIAAIQSVGIGASSAPWTGEAAGDTLRDLNLASEAQYSAAGANYTPPFADLSTATAATINQLREAFAIQRFQENRLRYGGRYVEYLRDLGVTPSDARLQRAEYLGGGVSTIQFSEVLQTGVTTSGATAGVGNLRGHGIGAMRSNKYRKFFEEHGYVISLMSIMPKSMYVTGIPRKYLKTTKTDYWQKELQHIGQQIITNKEVYAADTGPDDTFGYQDRYDEYRRIESTIAGDFRSSTAYDWHFARIFAADVTLNASFVTADPAVRPFADQSNDTLRIQTYHDVKALRPVAREGTPI